MVVSFVYNFIFKVQLTSCWFEFVLSKISVYHRKSEIVLKKNLFAIAFPIALFLLLSCGTQKTGEKETSSENESADSLQQKPAAQNEQEEMVQEYEVLITEYEDPERETWQNPTLVLDKLGDMEGSTVADIGSGTGYFTFPLAAVAGKVIAIDIESKFLDYIEDLKLDYPPVVSDVIETRLSQEDDPMLNEGEVDAVLMVNVYSYLNNRVAYLTKVKKGIVSGGLILIVDFKRGEFPVGPAEELKVPSEQVATDLELAGFEVSEVDRQSLKYQYIVKAVAH